MLLLRRTLVPFLALVSSSIFAHSQGPIAPPSSSTVFAREYPNSPDGLRWQLQDILNAARDHNRSRLEFLIRQTEIPDYEMWFTKTFGREKGESWAAPYGRNLTENEKVFADAITELAGEDGEFSARKINDDPAPARNIEAAMVNALQRPVDILFASWKGRGAPQDSKSSSIGYFVFLDGRFRWDSTVSTIEIQSIPASEHLAPQMGPPTDTAPEPSNPSSGNDRGPSRPGVGGVGYPSCDYCPQPEYTKLARKNQLEGTVVLQVIIQADGGVTDIHVVKSPNLELTQMAIEGVSKWHMNPARLADGEPVSVIVPIEVTFRLMK